MKFYISNSEYKSVNTTHHCVIMIKSIMYKYTKTDRA